MDTESENEPDNDRFEMLLGAGLAMIAGSVAQKVARRAWSASTGRTPPRNGRDDSANLAVLLLWGAAVGAAAGAARLLAERQAHTLAMRRRSRHTSA